MINKKPRVSIGMPVYNGENYMEEAIDSILAQTFKDFELIISDNASTDRTQEICKTYAAKDRRIRYYRNEKNLGAHKNFEKTFEVSSGEYFKWAAHDDFIAPDFISKCVEVLDRDPAVVLCFSKVKMINEFSEILGDPKKMDSVETEKIESSKLQVRFGELIQVNHNSAHVFGLMRADVLRKTPRLTSSPGSDRNLLSELALYGRFYDIPEYLFFLREHPERSTRVYDSRGRFDSRKYAIWHDPANKDRFLFQKIKVYLNYFRSVKRVPMNRDERIGCYKLLGKLAWTWKIIFRREIVKAIKFLTWKK